MVPEQLYNQGMLAGGEWAMRHPQQCEEISLQIAFALELMRTFGNSMLTVAAVRRLAAVLPEVPPDALEHADYFDMFERGAREAILAHCLVNGASAAFCN